MPNASHRLDVILSKHNFAEVLDDCGALKFAETLVRQYHNPIKMMEAMYNYVVGGKVVADLPTFVELCEGFSLYPFQYDILNALQNRNGSNTLLMKTSRRLGLSTLLNHYALYEAINTPLKKVAFFPTVARPSNSSQMFQMVTQNPLGMAAIGQHIDKWTSTNIDFYNGSRIMLAQSHQAMRGCSVDLIIIDGLYNSREDQMRLYESIAPCISRGGKIVVASPPITYNGLLAYMWNNLPADKLSYSWRDNPKFDNEWANMMQQQMSPAQWSTDYEAEFTV